VTPADTAGLLTAITPRLPELSVLGHKRRKERSVRDKVSPHRRIRVVDTAARRRRRRRGAAGDAGEVAAAERGLDGVSWSRGLAAGA
jgi:hypothetical protein